MSRSARLCTAFVALLVWPEALLATEYTFRSKLDNFTVDVSGGTVTFNGQRVNSEPFSFVKPLFESSFEDECEGGLGKPDLTIIRKSTDGNEVRRQVYIEAGVVSDGKNCGNVSGQGVYKLPLHRNWFAETKKVSIGLGQSFAIYKEGKSVVEFVKSERGWKSKVEGQFINWDFFNKFVSAVTDFPVDFRANPASATAKSLTFELHQGSRVFHFIRVGDHTWAVQFPGSPWFSASNQFGVFEDMEPHRWISPYEKQLRVIKDKTATKEDRLSAVRGVVNNTSPDITYVLHEVLQTDGDNPDVRREIALGMRKMPTNKNILALVDALRVTTDNELLNQFSKALRVKNPKGPVVTVDDDEKTAKEKVRTWVDWSKTLKD